MDFKVREARGNTHKVLTVEQLGMTMTTGLLNLGECLQLAKELKGIVDDLMYGMELREALESIPQVLCSTECKHRVEVKNSSYCKLVELMLCPAIIDQILEVIKKHCWLKVDTVDGKGLDGTEKVAHVKEVSNV